MPKVSPSKGAICYIALESTWEGLKAGFDVAGNGVSFGAGNAISAGGISSMPEVSSLVLNYARSHEAGNKEVIEIMYRP